MIRTEDDIRAACAFLEEDAPSAEDVLAVLTKHQPRRRPLRTYYAVAATVVVVAAVAVAALALPGRHRGSPTPPARTLANPALSKVDFTVVAPRGYRAVEYDSGGLFQRVSLVNANNVNGWATVTLYRPGGYDGTTTGPPVTVDGHPGAIVADAHPTTVGYRATDPTQHQRAVVWQYAPQAWALATGGSGSTAGAVDQANLLLARAIRPGSTDVRVPMKLSYLPVGLTGESSTTAPAGNRFGGLSLADGTAAGSSLDMAPWGSAMDVVAWTTHQDFSGRFGCPNDPRTFTVGSSQGCYLTDRGATSGLLIDLQGHTVRIRIDAAHYGKYPDTELVRILAGLTFAPAVDNPATWFPAGSALP